MAVQHTPHECCFFIFLLAIVLKQKLVLLNLRDMAFLCPFHIHFINLYFLFTVS